MSDALALLAAHYGSSDTRVLAAHGDNVLHVATSDGELAVKLFTHGELDRAEREAALLAHLDATPAPRFRVQRLVLTRSGDGIARGDQGVLLVTRWCDGVMKRYTAIVEPEWRALGATLAALHERLDSYAGAALPRLDDQERVDVVTERRAIEDSRRAIAERVPSRAAELGHYLDARLELLDARAPAAAHWPAVTWGPIHNDYNQHNYLFDGELPPIILDWEGAIAAPREYEVVRCMNHLPLVAPAHARAFVDGYRTVRTLDAAALRWAVDRTLTDHARKGWPLERWLAGKPDADAALTGSIEVLHALHARTAELEAFFAAEAG